MATSKRQVLAFPVPSVPGTRHISKNSNRRNLASPMTPLRPIFSLGNNFSQSTHINKFSNLLNKITKILCDIFSNSSKTPYDPKLLLRARIHIAGFRLETLLLCHKSISCGCRLTLIIILGPMKKRLEEMPPGLRIKKLGKYIRRIFSATDMVELENLGCNCIPNSVIRQCIMPFLQSIIWDRTTVDNCKVISKHDARAFHRDSQHPQHIPHLSHLVNTNPCCHKLRSISCCFNTSLLLAKPINRCTIQHHQQSSNRPSSDLVMVEVGISKHGDLDFSPLRVRHVVRNLFPNVPIDILPIVVISRVVSVVRHLCSELDSTLLMAF